MARNACDRDLMDRNLWVGYQTTGRYRLRNAESRVQALEAHLAGMDDYACGCTRPTLRSALAEANEDLAALRAGTFIPPGTPRGKWGVLQQRIVAPIVAPASQTEGATREPYPG